MNRFKRTSDIESPSPSSEGVRELQNRNAELEVLLVNFKQLLDTSRHREKKLIVALESHGGTVKLDNVEELFDLKEPSFYHSMLNRGGWLVGLLAFQSCSSFILAHNERLLQTHPTIVYFLTMLVGAGGNAGNQATVRVIRHLALGNLDRGKREYVLKEVLMAIALSFVVGFMGFLRVTFFSSVSHPEAVAVTTSLMLIVFISICTGALLPLLFHVMGIDPANSSTSIQVIMDISGVLITCYTATLLLDSAWGRALFGDNQGGTLGN